MKEMQIKCNKCGATDEVMPKEYYAAGGLRCRNCKGTMSPIPGKKVRTHLSSRERKPRGGQKA